jgi:nucleoside-triphosphatase
MRTSLRIAITGDPGSGKTTLVRRVVELLKNDIKIGGVYTAEVRGTRERDGFTVTDIATGRSALMASVRGTSEVRVGKYHVDCAQIEDVAVPALREARTSCDLVVIDEIAPMELACPAFVAEILQLFRTTKPMLVTFQKHARHPLCKQLWSEFRVEVVNAANRDALVAKLARGFKPRPKAAP